MKLPGQYWLDFSKSYDSSVCCLQSDPTVPEIIEEITIVLSYPLELDGKTLLRKASHM